MNAKARPVAPLDPEFTQELCRGGKIPQEQQRRFVDAVNKIVGSYLRGRNEKTAFDIGAELAALSRRVDRALKLAYRKQWRPGQFAATLQDISDRLKRLSPETREFLAWHNVRIALTKPVNWPAWDPDARVVDPAAFVDRLDQILALQQLYGALSHDVAGNRGPGRPSRGREQALYHFLCFAYGWATGKIGSDSSRAFMDVCEIIKDHYGLAEFRPASMARTVRRRRAKDGANSPGT
jgi:hypothetical protein